MAYNGKVTALTSFTEKFSGFYQFKLQCRHGCPYNAGWGGGERGICSHF